jgi:tuberculosinol/isotuberculosinol synthase
LQIPHTLAQWMALPAEDISGVVLPKRLAVLVSLDGTRRFANMRDPSSREDWARYSQLGKEAMVSLVDTLFALGVQTILITALWPSNFTRGNEYAKVVLGPLGLAGVTDATWRVVYDRWGARARLSGTWREAEPWMVEEMEKVAAQYVAATPEGDRLVLWEADAGDILEATLKLAAQVGHSRGAILAAQYPEGPERIHIAIKSGRLSTLDRIVSPVMLDKTDLYLVSNLTLELTEDQLRAILYDHLFLRHAAPEDNMSYSDQYLAAYRRWHDARPPRVVGLGELDPGGYWSIRGGDDSVELLKP